MQLKAQTAKFAPTT